MRPSTFWSSLLAPPLAAMLLGAIVPMAQASEHSQQAAQLAHTAIAKKVTTPVQITQAWIRPAVKGQSGTGGFMHLMSPQGATLLGFTASTVAGTSELHEMSMEGDVMRMRRVPKIELPAGQAVALQPGGLHLMLMGLKKPLKAGDKVPVVLKLKGPDGKAFTQRVSVPVLAPADAPKMMPGEHDMHGAHGAH